MKLRLNYRIILWKLANSLKPDRFPLAIQFLKHWFFFFCFPSIFSLPDYFLLKTNIFSPLQYFPLKTNSRPCRSRHFSDWFFCLLLTGRGPHHLPAAPDFLLQRGFPVCGHSIPGAVPQQHLPQHAGLHWGHPAVQRWAARCIFGSHPAFLALSLLPSEGLEVQVCFWRWIYCRKVSNCVLLMRNDPRQGSSLGSWFGELREWQERCSGGRWFWKHHQIPELESPEPSQLLQELSACLSRGQWDRKTKTFPARGNISSASTGRWQEMDCFYFNFHLSAVLQVCRGIFNIKWEYALSFCDFCVVRSTKKL